MTKNKSLLQTAIAAIKTTASGLVEYLTGTASLPAVHSTLVNIAQERIPYCATVGDLQALDGTECNLAYLEGVGIFVWYSGVAPLNPSYPVYTPTVLGLGYWAKKKTEATSSLSDVDLTGNASGKFLKWNGTKWVPDVPTVSQLDWGNVINKPIITGTTNPSIAGNLSVGGNETIGGNLGVTGTVTLDNGLISTNNATFSNNVTVTNNLSAGLNLTVTNNGTIGGTLGVTGNLTVNTNKLIANASTGDLTVAGGLTAAGLQSSAGLLVAGGPSVFDTYVGFPVWTTGTRPTSRPQGATGFNSTTHKLECWDGTAWNDLF
jgi:hypothetical protein